MRRVAGRQVEHRPVGGKAQRVPEVTERGGDVAVGEHHPDRRRGRQQQRHRERCVHRQCPYRRLQHRRHIGKIAEVGEQAGSNCWRRDTVPVIEDLGADRATVAARLHLQGHRRLDHRGVDRRHRRVRPQDLLTRQLQVEQRLDGRRARRAGNDEVGVDSQRAGSRNEVPAADTAAGNVGAGHMGRRVQAESVCAGTGAALPRPAVRRFVVQHLAAGADSTSHAVAAQHPHTRHFEADAAVNVEVRGVGADAQCADGDEPPGPAAAACGVFFYTSHADSLQWVEEAATHLPLLAVTRRSRRRGHGCKQVPRLGVACGSLGCRRAGLRWLSRTAHGGRRPWPTPRF